MTVIDMNGLLEEKKKQQERKEMQEHMNFLLSKMNKKEKEQLREAIETKNMDLWKEVTEPIMMRHIMKEMNKEVTV